MSLVTSTPAKLIAERGCPHPQHFRQTWWCGIFCGRAGLVTRCGRGHGV